MNKLPVAKQAEVIRLLCEGMSIRATCRATGTGKNTVARLLSAIGKACAEYQDDHLRNLGCMVVQCDEVWSFVGCKEKHATAEHKEQGHGSAWTWTALDSDSKLIITWHLGGRSEGDARDFIDDLADRMSKRIQLSTDGFGAYKNAVKIAFGKDVDYGIVVKMFNEHMESPGRYSPAICTSCKPKAVIGDPLESQISTSHVERSNLTIRMQNRRMTRLTNAFSKSLEQHANALALTFMFYNFARPHQTLTKGAGYKMTPAMAAGVADHVWTVAEIVALVN